MNFIPPEDIPLWNILYANQLSQDFGDLNNRRLMHLAYLFYQELNSFYETIAVPCTNYEVIWQDKLFHVRKKTFPLDLESTEIQLGVDFDDQFKTKAIESWIYPVVRQILLEQKEFNYNGIVIFGLKMEVSPHDEKVVAIYYGYNRI